MSGRSVEELRAATQQAADEGVDAVFVADSALGDAVTLVAALAVLTDGVLLGVRSTLRSHPTVVAREMTTLDHVCKGRALLALEPPFDAGTKEAMALCRDMWRRGIAAGEGPRYPVPGAVNHPGPRTAGGPPIALNATVVTPPSELIGLCDILVVAGEPGALGAAPAGVAVCQIPHA